MKRLITFFFVLLTLLWTLPATAQRANPQTVTRIRGASTNLVNIAAVRQLTLTYPATTWGLHTNSSSYYYDGANWRWWAGAQLNVDDIAVTTYVPRVGNFNHIYDMTQGQNNWDRMVGLDITLEPKDFLALLVYSANMYWDITNGYFDDWEGDALDNDAVPTTQRAPFVGSFPHTYQTDDDVWARDAGETADAGTLATTIDAAYRFALDYGYDSTAGAWRYVNTLDAVADDIALSLNWKTVAAVQLYFDGTGLDMGRVGATGEVQMTDVVVRPGENPAGNNREIYKQNTAPVAPSGIGPTAVDDTAGGIIVFPSTYVLTTPNWTLWIENTGGGSGDAFTDVWAEGSPDGVNWVSLATAESALENEADTLASGGVGIGMIGNNSSIAYIRLRAICAAGDDTEAEAWLTGNKN